MMIIIIHKKNGKQKVIRKEKRQIIPRYTSSVVKDAKISLTIPYSGVLMDQGLALNCFQTILIILSSEKNEIERNK